MCVYVFMYVCMCVFKGPESSYQASNNGDLQERKVYAYKCVYACMDAGMCIYVCVYVYV